MPGLLDTWWQRAIGLAERRLPALTRHRQQEALPVRLHARRIYILPTPYGLVFGGVAAAEFPRRQRGGAELPSHGGAAARTAADCAARRPRACRRRGGCALLHPRDRRAQPADADAGAGRTGSLLRRTCGRIDPGVGA